VATKRADRIESLAVLPLENLSGDPAEEFFADGMTEELISAVARIGSLRVISRTSVMQYKGARKSLAEIANQLRVDAIVEGSVTRSGERVRIVAQLIRVPEDRHAWSGRYERDLRDVLQMQAEVAQSIAGQVHKLLDPDCPGIPLRQVDPRAYEACLKGDFFRNKLSPADLKKSLRFFNQAIDLDPSYAPAYAGLSQTYYFLGVFGIGQPEHLVSRMRANAVRALELDETIAAAHNSLAAAHVFQNWDWAAAEAESRRALELDSRVSTTHAYLADYLSIRGCHDEAIVELHRALDLDPISLPWMGLLGLILYRARRYDEAIVQCLKALEIDGNYVNALWFLALALEQKGELSEAIAKLQQAANLSDGPHYQALLGRAYALAGERAKALGILEALFGLTRQRYVSPFDFGVLCAGLDDRDASLQWFEEAFHERVWRMSELTMPMFDGLRSEARWRNLVRRIGLQI